MDKIERGKMEYFHHSDGVNILINDILDKQDELVEGYNEIMKEQQKIRVDIMDLYLTKK